MHARGFAPRALHEFHVAPAVLEWRLRGHTVPIARAQLEHGFATMKAKQRTTHTDHPAPSPTLH